MINYDIMTINYDIMTIWWYIYIYIRYVFFLRKSDTPRPRDFFFPSWKPGWPKLQPQVTISGFSRHLKMERPAPCRSALSAAVGCWFPRSCLLQKWSTQVDLNWTIILIHLYSYSSIWVLQHWSKNAHLKGKKKGSVCCLSASFAVWSLGMLGQLSLSKGTQRLGQILSWFGFEVTMTDS